MHFCNVNQVFSGKLKTFPREEGFPNSGKEWGVIRNFAGGIFLPGSGNLRRSDFDQSNLLLS